MMPKQRRRQLEGLTLGEATAIIADIDELEGFPRLGNLGANFPEDKRVAALAWLAGPQTDPPPAGITQTAMRAEEKHDEPGNYAVSLTAEHEGHLEGRVVGGRAIVAGHFTERAEGWTRPEPDPDLPERGRS